MQIIEKDDERPLGTSEDSDEVAEHTTKPLFGIAARKLGYVRLVADDEGELSG